MGFNTDEEGILSPDSAVRWVEAEELKKGERKVQLEGVPSSLPGGIQVEVADWESSDEEEMRHETNQEAIEKLTINRVAKAAYAINRNERDELFKAREQNLKLREIISRNGISLMDAETEILKEDRDFNGCMQGAEDRFQDRDDFGFPIKLAFQKVINRGVDNEVKNGPTAEGEKVHSPKISSAKETGNFMKSDVGVSGVKDFFLSYFFGIKNYLTDYGGQSSLTYK
ncbi:MAG: hypothetical protein Q8832_02520 [Candidatus Phytoplasma australasiaticum]|nr:hypothetical protein [Candidatus Phytoplasma australasiaticum]